MTDEIPFKELFERALKEVNEKFKFTFTPNIDEYSVMVLRYIDMYFPPRFDVGLIQANEQLINNEKEELEEQIDYYLAQHAEAVKEINEGKDGIIKTRRDTIVNILNDLIVEYICLLVVEMLIEDRYGKMLEEYAKDVEYLTILKRRHRPKYFRRYLDKLFKEKYGEGSMVQIEVVKKEPEVTKETVTGVKIPDYVLRSLREKIMRDVSESIGINYEEFKEMREEEERIWKLKLSGEYYREMFNRGKRFTEEFFKKKKGGEGK